MSKFKVYKERCNQCLFSPNKVVSSARKRDILRQCAKTDGHFVCHKATIAGDDVCCKGFFDTHSTNLIRISERLNMIAFVDLPEDNSDA